MHTSSTVVSVRGWVSRRMAIVSTSSVSLWYTALTILLAACPPPPPRRFCRGSIPLSGKKAGFHTGFLAGGRGESSGWEDDYLRREACFQRGTTPHPTPHSLGIRSQYKGSYTRNQVTTWTTLSMKATDWCTPLTITCTVTTPILWSCSGEYNYINLHRGGLCWPLFSAL